MWLHLTSHYFTQPWTTLPYIAPHCIKSDSFRNPPYTLYLLYLIIPRRLLKKGLTSPCSFLTFCRVIPLQAYHHIGYCWWKPQLSQVFWTLLHWVEHLLGRHGHSKVGRNHFHSNHQEPLCHPHLHHEHALFVLQRGTQHESIWWLKHCSWLNYIDSVIVHWLQSQVNRPSWMSWYCDSEPMAHCTSVQGPGEGFGVLVVLLEPFVCIEPIHPFTLPPAASEAC